jgi:hypothetical protein
MVRFPLPGAVARPEDSLCPWRVREFSLDVDFLSLVEATPLFLLDERGPCWVEPCQCVSILLQQRLGHQGTSIRAVSFRLPSTGLLWQLRRDDL